MNCCSMMLEPLFLYLLIKIHCFEDVGRLYWFMSNYIILHPFSLDICLGMLTSWRWGTCDMVQESTTVVRMVGTALWITNGEHESLMFRHVLFQMEVLNKVTTASQKTIAIHNWPKSTCIVVHPQPITCPFHVMNDVSVWWGPSGCKNRSSKLAHRVVQGSPTVISWLRNLFTRVLNPPCLAKV